MAILSLVKIVKLCKFSCVSLWVCVICFTLNPDFHLDSMRLPTGNVWSMEVLIKQLLHFNLPPDNSLLF